MILEMKHMICNAIAAVLLSAALVSCTKGFDEMNVNPNSPTPDSVDPNYLISPIIVSSTLEVNIYQRIHNLYNDTFAQYFAMSASRTMTGHRSTGTRSGDGFPASTK